MRTVNDVIARLPVDVFDQLPKPPFQPHPKIIKKAALAVGSMQCHMSDEGWQIMMGLAHTGYYLCGRNLDINETNMRAILARTQPGTVVLQDKREWDGAGNNRLAHKYEYFSGVRRLRRDHHPEIFKLTILKDSHQRPAYHRESAEEIDCHAWIIYYHPKIVKHLAPYVRPEHLIRTYHSIDPKLVPPYKAEHRTHSILSGALSVVYPLRVALLRNIRELPDCFWQPHPGYHNLGTNTPGFIRQLTKFKVAICTSSIYGYALRKIVEATACGCVVLTDLPVDEVMPEIDGNLVRFESNTVPEMVQEAKTLLPALYQTYNPERQAHYAQAALKYYDYKAVTKRLADDIETLRSNY